MINAGTVSVKLFADVKQFQAGMAGASASVGKMTKDIQNFAKKSIFAFAAITAASAKMATDFDKRLREISTLIIGVTEKDIKNMSREIRDLANLTGKALDDLGKAKYDIISAGFTDMGESIQLLNTSARLAVAGVTSVTNSADLLTSALNSWQKSGYEAEHAADVLFTTVRLGKTTMDELVGSVGRVFPTANALGASLEDVGAAMATITAGGIKTYEAATYLNQAFTKLGAPSQKASLMMDLYGISVKRARDGSLDLFNTIKQFKGYNLEEMREFFPEIRAIKAVLSMTHNLEFLKRALDSTNNSAGEMRNAFEDMSKAWSVKLNKSVMKFKDEMINIGNKIMPSVVKSFDNIIDGIADLDISNFSNSLKGVVSSLGKISEFLVKHADTIVNLTKVMATLAISNGLNKAGKASIKIFSKLSKILGGMGMGLLVGGGGGVKALSKISVIFGNIGAYITLASEQIGLFTGSLATVGGVASGTAASIGGMFSIPVLGQVLIALTAITGSIYNIDSGIKKIKKNNLFEQQKKDYRTYLSYIKNAKKNGVEVAISATTFLEFTNLNNEENRKDAILAINNYGRELQKDLYKNPLTITIPVVAGLEEVNALLIKHAEDEKKKNDKKEEPFGTGFVTKDFGLKGVNIALRNLEEYNKSLVESGKNTFKFSKEVFDAFGLPLEGVGKFIDVILLSNNTMSELEDTPTSKIGSNMKLFIDTIKRLGYEGGLTIESIKVWYDEFVKTIEKDVNPAKIDLTDLEKLVNAVGKASNIGNLDFSFIESLSEIDVTSLEDAVRLVGKWGVSLGQATENGIYTKEQAEALAEAFAKLEEKGISLEKLKIHFGLGDAIEDAETFGESISREFVSIGSSISGTMANSFAEIALSGRVAMQELEKYNKGLTNTFRTQAEIQQDAWANMWNNILVDTVSAIAEMLIKYGLLTLGLIVLNLLSGGMLSIALGATNGVGKDGESINKGWQFLADLFKSAGGEGFTNMFVNDGVITPDGQVVHTAPDDYIMAMKDPASFGKNAGGGGDIYNVTLQMMDATDVEGLINRHKQPFAKGIGTLINNRNLVVKTSGQNARASY